DVLPRAPRREHGDRRVADQDEKPEEERALLAVPERRQPVARREAGARVLGDVREGEVVAEKRGDENGRGDGGRVEGGEERVPRGEREASAAACGCVAARERGVGQAAEGDEQRGAA